MIRNNEKTLGQKILFSLIAILTMFALMFITYFCLHNYKKLSVNRLDINAVIKSNGNVDVVENYEYKFIGEYNGIYRDFRVDNCDGYIINEIIVTDKKGNSTKFNSSTMGTDGNYYLDNDGNLKIYSKSKNETKKVSISYTIKNAAKKYEESSVFYWQFYELIGKDTIKEGSLTVSLDNIKNNKHKILNCDFYGMGNLNKIDEDKTTKLEFEELSSNLGVLVEFDREFLGKHATKYDYKFDVNNEAPLNQNSGSQSSYIETWVVYLIMFIAVFAELIKALYFIAIGRPDKIFMKRKRDSDEYSKYNGRTNYRSSSSSNSSSSSSSSGSRRSSSGGF